MMNLLNEYELAFGVLPSEPEGNQVIYVENHKNPELEHYITTYLDKLKKLFSEHGLEFIYVPAMVDTLTDDDLKVIAGKYIPGLDDSDLKYLRSACKIAVENIYSNITSLGNNAPAIVNSRRRAFRIDVSKPVLYYEQFRQIAEAYERGPRRDDGIRFRESSNTKPKSTFKRFLSEFADKYSTLLDESGESAQQVRECADVGYSYPSPPSLDEKEIRQLVNELMLRFPPWLLKQMLSKLLEQNENTSTLVFNKRKKFILPEYNNVEIELYPAEKAFYLLFLRHPEGIRMMELVDYRNELLYLYKKVSSRDDNEAMEKTVDKLVNQLDDSYRNSVRSKIKSAFKSKINPVYVHNYEILGEAGEKMRVELARNKINMEVDW